MIANRFTLTIRSKRVFLIRNPRSSSVAYRTNTIFTSKPEIITQLFLFPCQSNVTCAELCAARVSGGRSRCSCVLTHKLSATEHPHTHLHCCRADQTFTYIHSFDSLSHPASPPPHTHSHELALSPHRLTERLIFWSCHAYQTQNTETCTDDSD